MDLDVIENYEPIFKTPKNIRYILIIGGRGAGRSYVVSQLIVFLMRTSKFFRGAVMRFVLGDVRNSNFQEVVDRIEEQNLTGAFEVKDLEIKFGSNFLKGLGFRKSSGDQKSKMKSLAGFNFIHIEEADEVDEAFFMQLDDSLRTTNSNIIVVLTMNPPDKNNWIMKRYFNLIPSGIEGFYRYELKEEAKKDTLFIFSTYKENIKNLNQSTVDNYLKYKENNPDYYYNMIEGLVSEGARGRIFKNWKRISTKEFEELPYPSYFGLDFGYTNDPSALIEIKEHNNKVYLRELIYETGLTNQRLSERMIQKGVSKNKTIYADSAEPKSIDELRILGWIVLPASKGADSVRSGIDMLLSKEVFYTEDSKNIDLESQEYKWALDKNKEPTNEPIDDFNHTMDATRYGIFTKSKTPYIGF